MAKEKKSEVKEIYSSMDLIARGTYTMSHPEFWDSFYKCFPELSKGSKIVNVFQPNFNITDDEILCLVKKENSQYQYAAFYIDQIDIEKISNNLIDEIAKYETEKKKFIILELEFVNEKYTIVRQYLL
jgi:hypothetical protein